MDTENFCGRKLVLELLKRRVLDLKEGYRQNLALLGYPYVGKTAILHKFLSDIDDKDAIKVYLNLENQDFAYFYHRVVTSLLYQFLKSRNLPLHEDLSVLLEATREHLPQTVKNIKKIQTLLSQHKRSDAYREIISLPQIFAQESNMFCVLVLDEFHELENLGVADVFKILGAKIMTQKRCLYVVASSFPSVAEGILSEKMSLLFGNFEKIMVEPFDLKISEEFIRLQLPGLKMSDTLRYFLTDFSGGQALPLQLICEQITALAVVHRQQEVFLPLLTQAIEKVLFHPWGLLSRHFDLLLQQLNPAKNNFPVLSILLALADGRKKMKDLAADCGLKQATVQQRMARLLEQGVILKNGNFYYLKDKVFRYWLKNVFCRRQSSIDLDSGRSRELFQQDLWQAYESFLANSQKDLSTRIMDLLACFEKEAFQINGRRYELPLFQEINPARIEQSVGDPMEIIRAATTEGEWLVALKGGMVCENDINLILNEAKKIKQKPQRCILISLHDLDENARVRALQERMWIWSEGELRALLNIFDKPYIIPT